MKNLSLLCALLCVFILSSCNTVSVTTDYDKSANFSSYKTYAFHEKGITKLKINDLDKRRIVAAIDAEMAAKGFTKVTSNADLVVNILASSSQELYVNNNYGYYGYWGNSYANVSEYTSGKIIIDIIDDKKNILVWQGIGSGLNVDNIAAKSEKIPQAINEVLTKFPPLNK
ncbi:DUF4136 domain-containing protein [Faecalibacter rhinopitheci]|uniref:DUF4136 domain-containing protein n=1 Tax=Faecalibacter rhinopitheci TaxID=2779678 RepID=A0A8J7G6T2_9FLAO|nr:DUF4136 domain-containing protein [Faecalibacter rhinopitheci]MBF0597902.1 DUF4136 domain-containing protein [Faecalibacter rhinopitheci]